MAPLGFLLFLLLLVVTGGCCHELSSGTAKKIMIKNKKQIGEKTHI